MTYPDVFILRHGETEWNLARRIQGQKDSSLTELGRTQAQMQRDLLQPILQKFPDIDMHCSPLGRAQATARIALGCSPRVRLDLRLQEIGAGSWEGLTRDEVAKGWPDEWALCLDDYDLFTRTPDGESVAQAFARAEAFLKELRGPAIVVTHGVFSCFLRGILQNQAVEQIADMPRRQGVIYHLQGGRERVIEKKSDFGDFLQNSA